MAKLPLPKPYSTDFQNPRVKPVGDVEVDWGVANPSFYYISNNVNISNNKPVINSGSTVKQPDILFDGVDDYFENNASKVVGVSGWAAVRYKSTSSGRQNIIGLGNTSGNAVFRYTLNYQPGVPGATAGYLAFSANYSSSARAYVDLGSVLYDGEEHDIFVSWDGADIRMWFDGAEQTLTFTSINSHSEIDYEFSRIGEEVVNASSNYRFNGTLKHAIGNLNCSVSGASILASLLRNTPYQILKPKVQPVYWTVGAAPPAGTSPKGPFTHPLYGPFRGPIS